MAVVVSAGHMAKAVAKLVSWGGYLPFALREPLGLENAAAIGNGAIAKPISLLPMSTVSAIGLATILVMLGFALRESRLADSSTHRTRIAPILVAGLAAAFLVFGWAFLP